ncbi:hypothetical protein C7C46_09695 [Streptomyces tateyamensis]|uniref:Vitamin K epoxide reductase domain-containing protein n=1 Tax=Streptomyces tateyamensis TaxID=565073 RepID=A0A2V4NFM7_9ACTN|nr:vitamin K epoxide reductase family protein [Streptomyces tateyamensis]PYC82625.1 hypothetical protein C7C46_09695 [Streptomyces tateyamensis]
MLGDLLEVLGATEIGALCPYCIAVWAATIPLFWYTTLHNLQHEVIPLPARWRPATELAVRYHWVVPVVWYPLIALMILKRVW